MRWHTKNDKYKVSPSPPIPCTSTTREKWVGDGVEHLLGLRACLYILYCPDNIRTWFYDSILIFMLHKNCPFPGKWCWLLSTFYEWMEWRHDRAELTYGPVPFSTSSILCALPQHTHASSVVTEGETGSLERPFRCLDLSNQEQLIRSDNPNILAQPKDLLWSVIFFPWLTMHRCVCRQGSWVAEYTFWSRCCKPCFSPTYSLSCPRHKSS